MNRALAQRCVLVLVLSVHVGIVAWQANAQSPNFDELGHLSAGLAIWKLGRFDLYNVNPPLVKTLAAIPAFVAGAETPWQHFSVGTGERAEMIVATDFLESNDHHAFL